MFAVVAVSKSDVVGVEHIFAAETKNQVLSYISLKWNENRDMLPRMQEQICRKDVDTPEKLKQAIDNFNERAFSYHIIKCDFPVVHVDRVVLDSIVPVEDESEDENPRDDEDMHDPDGDVDTEPGSSPEVLSDPEEEDVHYDGEDCVCMQCIQHEVNGANPPTSVLASVPREALSECPPPLPKAELRPAQSNKMHLRSRAVETLPPHLLKTRTTPLRTQSYAVRYEELDDVEAAFFVIRNRIRSKFDSRDLFGYLCGGNLAGIVYETDSKHKTMDLEAMEELQRSVCNLPTYVSRF